MAEVHWDSDLRVLGTENWVRADSASHSAPTHISASDNEPSLFPTPFPAGEKFADAGRNSDSGHSD